VEDNANYLKARFDPKNKEHVSAVDELAFWSAPFGMLLLSTIKMKTSIKVLDIGFGTGFPLIELADRLGSGSSIYGVDPWEKGAERAREKIHAREVQNVSILVQQAEQLPFEDSFFDLVVSNNGLNNVQEPEKVFSEIYRTLKPNGQLVFTMNLPETMKEFYDIFQNVLRDFQLLDEIPKMMDHIHLKRKPLDETRDLIRKTGLKIEQEILDSFDYRFADGTATLNYYVIREFFMPAWIEFLPFHNVKSVFKEIETRLNHLAAERGEVRLQVPFVCFDCLK
jgi:ubiquinone/menaquinone biosynthesis C-methylase UbiE